MTAPAESTRELLCQTHSGDPQALSRLLEAHLPWIHEHVRKRLSAAMRMDGDTRDFVQEAVVDVLRTGPRFVVSDPGHFRAIMARIVENNIRDRRRYMDRGCRDVSRRRDLARDSLLMLDPPAHSVTRPEDRADQNEQLAWLHLALELLDPDDREIIRGREWDNASFAELGAMLGTTEGGARKRYARALPKLAAKVGLLREGRLSQLTGE
jgi:RNA polymerase sigma factor (sigma-70 family)